MLPKKVEALKKVALVAGGWRHTLAANEDGKLYAWGWNKFGQLGVGHNEDLCAPGPVVGLEGEKVQQLSSGWKHTLVVTESGKFYGWGRGVNGQLGRGDTADANTPVLVPDLSAGGIAVDALMKETHPVVMYSIPPGDRYAVVPDHGTDGGNGVPHAVPDMEVPTKKQRV